MTEIVGALHARDSRSRSRRTARSSPPDGIDWICVSPKVGAPLVLTRGNELKLVFPQAGGEPERFADLDFEQFFLQPMDGPDRERTRSSRSPTASRIRSGD